MATCKILLLQWGGGMHAIPDDILRQFEKLLRRHGVSPDLFAHYRKWLRYFLDFRVKYPISCEKSEQVRLFLEKLKEKKQTEAQRQQAAHSVSLYFEISAQETTSDGPNKSQDRQTCYELTTTYTSIPSINERIPQYCEAGYIEKSDPPEWDEVLRTMAEEIKVRHYSRKTLKTYANRSRRFQFFLKNKPPHELSTTDVKNYLTFLAIKCKVAASTQNQAFNSLRENLRGQPLTRDKQLLLNTYFYRNVLCQGLTPLWCTLTSPTNRHLKWW
jgi:hypothetical protein